jgi:5-methylcytosine-specific restriction endonuclease McrA
MFDAAKARTLLLNADMRPLELAPLSTLGWQSAIKGIVRGELFAVAEYETIVRSQHLEMFVPSVVVKRSYEDLNRPAAFTRENVFAAYDCRCGYCGDRFSTRELTFDHIVPRSHGGGSSWMNTVPACVPCNARKRDRTPEQARMPLRVEIRQPSVAEINARAAFSLDLQAIKSEWLDFVYWGVELER